MPATLATAWMRPPSPGRGSPRDRSTASRSRAWADDRDDASLVRGEIDGGQVQGEHRPALREERLDRAPAHAAAGPGDEGDTRVGHRTVTPPSIRKSAPVTYDDALVAR